MYLVDNNLPRYLALWSSPSFQYVRDIDPAWADVDIWAHAQVHGFTVLTKDADFLNLAMLEDGAAKLVHFRVENLRLAPFMNLIERIWPDVEQGLQANRVVLVYRDRIECVE